MATQTFTAASHIQPLERPIGGDPAHNVFPWGKLTFTIAESLAIGASGDFIRIDLPLPTNYVYRMRKLYLTTSVNSGANEWSEWPYYRHYWSPNETTQGVNTQEYKYRLLVGEINDDAERGYFIGAGTRVGVAGSLHQIFGDYFPDQLITQVTGLIEYDAYTINQRNHASINTTLQVS